MKEVLSFVMFFLGWGWRMMGLRACGWWFGVGGIFILFLGFVFVRLVYILLLYYI